MIYEVHIKIIYGHTTDRKERAECYHVSAKNPQAAYGDLRERLHRTKQLFLGEADRRHLTPNALDAHIWRAYAGGGLFE